MKNSSAVDKRFPARLHVLLASQAPVGVVLRRGPSKSVCSVLWNRKTDQFEVGQWLHGRIYERRSDLSPDGRYLIYFAMNYGRRSSETEGSWTAVSRAPWLKAIVLLGKGDCWHGGGLFTSNTHYWLNDGYGHSVLNDSREVHRDLQFQPCGYYGGECAGVYFPRLQRDGWVWNEQFHKRGSNTAVFEKQLPRGWILRKYFHAGSAPPGKGVYWEEHELESPKLRRTLTFPKWEWAELDGKTLVWAENGRLYRAPLHAKELGTPKMLLDFDAMKFERRVAPYS